MSEGLLAEYEDPRLRGTIRAFDGVTEEDTTAEELSNLSIKSETTELPPGIVPDEEDELLQVADWESEGGTFLET